MDISPTVESSPVAPGTDSDIEALINARHPASEARQLKQLLGACFRHQLMDGQLRPQDLYGALLCAWQRLQQHRAGTIGLAVFNTDPQQDAWHCDHSLIEILMDDQPFIAASCLSELARLGIRIHHQAYPALHLRRDSEGRLLELCESKVPGARTEALVRFEIDRQADPAALAEVRDALARVLEDVHCSVADWQAMLERVEEAARACETADDRDSETVDFLRWLADEHFLFVGYRYYDIGTDESGCYQLHYRDGSGLGCFRDPVSESKRLIRLDADQSELLRAPQRLVLTRSTTRSTVQQNRHLDYIGVKNLDGDGRLIGEWRFFGLYSSQAYDTPVSQIPLIRRHVRRLLESSGLSRDSHGYKALRHLLFNYPRDEMLQSGYEQLRETILGMLDCVERRRLGLFLRPDAHDRFIKVLMLVPRDQYNTQLRVAVQEILLAELGGHSAEFGVRLSEEPLALIEFCIHCRQARRVEYDRDRLYTLVLDAMESWPDKLQRALEQDLGEYRGNSLFGRFAGRLPLAYREATDLTTAVADLKQLAALKSDQQLATRLEPLALAAWACGCWAAAAT
ncbi:hypothetical protein [Marinobacterium aestuariivivens]|uniref:NAD-glutamate dehydrogenase n=1 Tax=Marinobacterium aestuariivivens TaxID=1698799 RepID=A0ABW2A172_9GAMM